MMDKYFADKGLGGNRGMAASFEPMKHSLLEGWLSKGMRYVSQEAGCLYRQDDNPMDVLGIGAEIG